MCYFIFYLKKCDKCFKLNFGWVYFNMKDFETADGVLCLLNIVYIKYFAVNPFLVGLNFFL